MLSESYMLYKSLKANNIDLPFYHPRVKSPGRSFGNIIKVSLSATVGQVKTVEELVEEETSSLWTIREGNQNSFPVIRLPIPLGTLKKKDKNLLKRLQQIKAAELKSLTNLPQNLIHFAESFISACKDIDVLVQSITNNIIEASKNNRFNKNLAEEIIKGPRDSQIQIAFDLENDSIYTRDNRNSLEAILPFEILKKKLKSKSVSLKCAFTGNSDVLQIPFPKVTLPIFNREFPIFSMFKDAKCNYRYGLIGNEIVPLSLSESLNIAKAMLWILDDHKYEKTWRGISQGKYEKRGRRKIDKRDLLVVYVEGKPDILINIANIFGTNQDSIIKQFETDAKIICDKLKGLANNTPASKINLFVLREVSEGQQPQVVISDSLSVNQFIQSAELWSRAFSENLPNIDIVLPPSQKGEKAIIAKPPVLYPEEVVKILSRKYICQGLDMRETKGISFGEVINFMLRKDGKWEDALNKLQSLVLQCYESLLIGLFGAKLRLLGKYSSELEKKKFHKYKGLARKDALQAISLLGLILDANGRNKENYMKNAAFKIGGFLALADILHKDYCIAVRNNSLPPSLIGNAMMPRTFDNPCLAIDDLADRMRIYTGWAKTVKVPDNNEEKKIAVLEAKKTMVRYEILSKLLHEIGLPDQCDDGMKAEILLGYLASTKGIDIETNETEQEVIL